MKLISASLLAVLAVNASGDGGTSAPEDGQSTPSRGDTYLLKFYKEQNFKCDGSRYEEMPIQGLDGEEEVICAAECFHDLRCDGFQYDKTLKACHFFTETKPGRGDTNFDCYFKHVRGFRSHRGFKCEGGEALTKYWKESDCHTDDLDPDKGPSKYMKKLVDDSNYEKEIKECRVQCVNHNECSAFQVHELDGSAGKMYRCSHWIAGDVWRGSAEPAFECHIKMDYGQRGNCATATNPLPHVPQTIFHSNVPCGILPPPLPYLVHPPPQHNTAPLEVTVPVPPVQCGPAQVPVPPVTVLLDLAHLEVPVPVPVPAPEPQPETMEGESK